MNLALCGTRAALPSLCQAGVSPAKPLSASETHPEPGELSEALCSPSHQYLWKGGSFWKCQGFHGWRVCGLPACLPACLGMPAVCNSHNFPLKSADTSCFFVKPQLLNWHSYLRISKGDFQPFLSLKKTWNIAETLQCPPTHVHWATVDYLLLVSLCFLMFSQYFPSVQVTIFVC